MADRVVMKINDLHNAARHKKMLRVYDDKGKRRHTFRYGYAIKVFFTRNNHVGVVFEDADNDGHVMIVWIDELELV